MKIISRSAPGFSTGLSAVIVSLSAPGPATSADPSTTAPAMSWGAAIKVATGEAQVGPWRMNDSDWRYVDDPTVAIDERGRVAVAWVDQSRKDVFFRRYGPGGQALETGSVNVSRSPGVFSWLPRVVSGTGGRVFVLWQEIVFSGGSHGGEAFFARSSDGGRSFSDPVNLSNSRAGDGKGRLGPDYWHNGSLDLARGPGGGLYAAWTEYEGRLWLSRSQDDGRSFSEPLLVAGGAGDRPARGPALATASGERVYLAWTVGEDPGADIHMAISTDGGRTFGAPRVVAESSGHADAPKIAVDGRGVVHLVYADSPTGPLQQYRIRYTRSTDRGATFQAPTTISDPIPEAYDSASYPGLAVDGGNNLYVLWHLSAGRGQRPRALGFTVAGDGGQTFGRPSPVPGLAATAGAFSGSLQGLLVSKLAVNDAGTVAVVNSTFMRNEHSSVRLVKGALDDAPGAQ